MTRTNSYRLMFYIALVAITLLALLPQGQVVVTTGWDKSNHLLAFFVLLLLLDRSYVGQPLWRVKLPLLLLYGLWIELLQWFMPDRFFSGLDVFADGVGLLLYALLASPITRCLDELENKFGLLSRERVP